MIYTELNFYEPTPEDRCGDFERFFDTCDLIESDIEECECDLFEVVFDFHAHRYYCYIYARTMDEALGLFFRHHPHITYDMILDHCDI